MAKKKDEPKVTFEGTEYLLKDLSENARLQVSNIQFTDARIQQLSSESAVADTARIGYTNALKSELLVKKQD
jgi:50S ribosomal subunit-associated GTPase HflX